MGTSVYKTGRIHMNKHIALLTCALFTGIAYGQEAEMLHENAVAVTENIDVEPENNAVADTTTSTTQGVTMEQDVKIGINAQQQKKSIDILNTLLADEFVLLVQTLNYHWNLTGPEFNDYHALFNKQYHEIFEYIDAVAERARAVGGTAVGSLQSAITQASLTEDTGATPNPREMVKRLLAQHEAVIRSIRAGIDQTAQDAGTNNFLNDLIEKHEKTAWMLRSLAR